MRSSDCGRVVCSPVYLQAKTVKLMISTGMPNEAAEEELNSLWQLEISSGNTSMGSCEDNSHHSPCRCCCWSMTSTRAPSHRQCMPVCHPCPGRSPSQTSMTLIGTKLDTSPNDNHRISYLTLRHCLCCPILCHLHFIHPSADVHGHSLQGGLAGSLCL